MTSLKQNSTHIRTRLAWQKTYPFGFKIMFQYFYEFIQAQLSQFFWNPIAPNFFRDFLEP